MYCNPDFPGGLDFMVPQGQGGSFGSGAFRVARPQPYSWFVACCSFNLFPVAT
jgi:hypothetical protein